MKKCPYCAEEVQDAAVVCKHCGRDLSGGRTKEQATGKQKAVVGSLLVLAALVALVIWSAQTSSPDYSTGTPAVATATTIRIVDEAVEIPAGSYQYWTWEGPGHGTCRIHGRIEGISGGQKDVRIALVDADQLTNLKNGLSFQAYHWSDPTAVASLDHRLPGTGSFALVLSNAHAAFTPKVVQAKNVVADCGG